jgi:predicted peptidase
MKHATPFVLLALLLLPLALPAALKDDWRSHLARHVFETGKGKLPYRLLVPDDYDPKKSYPLVIFLHGAGERGTNNEAQLVHGVSAFARETGRKSHPCFLIAPQCPPGKRWVEVDWSAKAHKMPAEPSEPMALLLELLPQLQKRYSIDPKRIYVTGLSMGGFGTWDLLARRPSAFAAAIPICGGGDESTAARIKDVPVWVFHGDRDGAVKVERSRNMVAALRKAGGKPKYTEYKGVGHDSWTRTYNDPEVLKWLFAQRRE